MGVKTITMRNILVISKNSVNLPTKEKKDYDLNWHILRNFLVTRYGTVFNIYYDTIYDINPDLVIAFGGDGTFLSAAQQYSSSYLLGINSDPNQDPKKGSIGALTSINANQIKEKLPTILYKFNTYPIQLKLEEWPVLSVLLNGEIIKDKIAINEVYFGPEFGYQTCDFNLRLNMNEEDTFNSSGLIVSTGMGSNAWYMNAGGTPFSNDLKAIGIIVREPNLKRNPKLTQKVIPIGNPIEITPLRSGYKIHFDSSPEGIKLNNNDKVEIISNRSIKVIQ